MSFGFSVGDFISAIQLANKLRKEFVGAPGQFMAISDEVRGLSIVLQDAEVVLAEWDANEQQRAGVDDVLRGCHIVLKELEKALDRYGAVAAGGSGLRSRVKREWKKLKWEPEEMREFRDRITSNVSLLNTIIGRIASDAVQETKRGVDQLNRRQGDKDRLDILNWLTPIDYSLQQNDFLSHRQPGTGQWLLSSEEYTSWRQSSGQVLFCPGIPGAGKTILTSIVIENLASSFPETARVAVAYIYCNFRREHQQQIEMLLASLLKQLAEGQASIPKSIRELYNSHREKRTQPSESQLQKAIRSVVLLYERVFVVIDALDECQPSDGCRPKLLSELLSLQTDHEVNIFATSRFIPEITEALNYHASLEIRARDEDVEGYLDGHLAQFPSFVRRSLALQQEIKTEIIKSVSGMYVRPLLTLTELTKITRFLLAQLYLDSLKGKRSPKAIRNALNGLATGLDASGTISEHAYDRAYDDAMERIECQLSDESDLAKHALSWIVCASRPLSTVELQHALAVEEDTAELDEENLSEIEDIVSVCAGLVTVDEGSDVIRLVHYTAQDYFQRTQTRWFPDAEVNITSACLTYLSFSAFDGGPCHTRTEYEHRLRSNPLYKYAARNWGGHAAELTTVDAAFHRFFEDTSRLEAASQAAWAVKDWMRWIEGYNKHFPVRMTGLHWAAVFGLDKLVRSLLDRNALNAQDSRGYTPLARASIQGHTATVRLLLQEGADCNMQDTYGLTPLNHAVWRGALDIARLLLDHGAKVDGADHGGWTPLALAAMYDEEAIARLLLESDACVHVKDSDGQTALSYAAKRGFVTIAKLLLEHGSDANVQHKDGWTPLLWAVIWGHRATVQVLLENGADVHLRNKGDRTALHEAAQSGDEMSIIRLLLQHGADVDAADDNGLTPLMRAVVQGQEARVRFLLENGASVHVKNGDGQTALSWEASTGSVTMARLLLEYGSEANVQDKSGWTPLMEAANHDHRATIQTLFEHGADVHLKDALGRTALFFAAHSGHETIVRLLLEHGSDINAEDEDGLTPHATAAQGGHGELAQLLLDEASRHERT